MALRSGRIDSRERPGTLQFEFTAAMPLQEPPPPTVPSSTHDDNLVVDAILEALRDRGRVRVTMWGRSMLPLVWPGADVDIVACDVDDVEIGDVVLVRTGRGLMTHRLVAREGTTLQTSGDLAGELDPAVTKEQLLGRARGVPVARGTLPLPRPVQRVSQNLYLRGLPLARVTYNKIEQTGGAIWRRVRRQTWIKRARRRLTHFEIQLADGQRIGLVRRYLLRRGVRPTHYALSGWHRKAASERGPFAVVARVRGRLVGSLRTWPISSQTGECVDLWVDRWYRDIGIGSALIQEVVAEARRHGFHRLDAHVRPSSDGAAVFLAAGFRPRPDTRREGFVRVELRVGAL